MGIRFTESLRQATEPKWSQCTGHRFVSELFQGAVPDSVMTDYLVQDHRFIDHFLTLLGAALATTDRFEARIKLGQFIGVISGDENSYFLRSFDALGVTEAQRASQPDRPATTGFKALMAEAANSRSYVAALAVLNVAEWLYLDWAIKAPQPLPDNFLYAEWITLHDNPFFQDFVAFLRAELDRVGPQDPETARQFFERAVDLELAFFNQAYEMEG